MVTVTVTQILRSGYLEFHVLRHQWAYSCEKAKVELDYNSRSLKEGLEEVLPYVRSIDNVFLSQPVILKSQDQNQKVGDRIGKEHCKVNLQEDARALLGRLEYQKGNIEAALHVFEGIDIAAVTPRMKGSISRRCEQNRRRSQSDSVPPMSMHAVSLLLEAVLLKAKSLQGLG
ncbi:protein NPGR2-like isoform X4 [Humulus lupulus]|uniref:protein NPGR2-like isoform X4 n=1 Tax=Humulus lupulus TaxID=3486 RepID=UPI002B415358|nr:protein NPGR2-like isoform X4 [Humulus lupulus]